MTWQIDHDHSSLSFSARHMMVTTVRGAMRIAELDLEFDPERPGASRVEAKIAAASIDTGVEQRDAHLRSADFLDAEQHPYVTFRSNRLEPDGQAARIHGDLTIRGQTRPVVLDAEFLGIVPNLQGGRRAAFRARTAISREDWGLTWNVALESSGWLVGKEITVEVEIAAVEMEAAASEVGAA